MRVTEWTLRSAATPIPWVVAGVILGAVDFVSPPQLALCTLHLALLLMAFQFLPRRNIPRLIIFLIATTVIPYLLRPPYLLEPVRVWVTLGLLAAAYYHNDSQRRRRRRLVIRQQLQRRVRRRALQIRRINAALRREIARRQETQHRLNRTETHLQSLAQRMQLQVIRKDIEGVITYANDAFCRGVGRSVDDVIGSTDSDLYPPTIANAYMVDDERVLKSGEAVDHIESHPMADGKTGWVQVFKAPEYDEQSRIIGIQMVFWDVTDSYRKTAELRRSEARKRALFDAAREAVLLVDERGLVVEANPAAEAMLAIGNVPLAGNRLEDIASPQSSLQGLGDEQSPADPMATEADRRLAGEASGRAAMRWADLPPGQRREIVLRTAADPTLPAEVSVHPIPLEDSIGQAIFIRDVTLRHRALAALRDAKAAAEAASRIKSEFMASVSHEIRTPLGGITGSAELLSQMNLPPRAQQYVQMIRHSGELLSSVIGDILDLASIEAGRLQINPEPTDLHRCIGEAFRFLATRGIGKDVEMVLDIRPGVPRHVVVDANRLRQIVINLAGNALKFTLKGHVLLRLSVDATGVAAADDTAGPRRFLKLEMIDTGIGIAPDRLGKIFEPFEQGDSGTTRRFGGTGLGLSISDQLVRRMGGTLDVESRVGSGSHFRCRLPLIEPDKDDSDNADSDNADEGGDADQPKRAAERAGVARRVAVRIGHPVQRAAIVHLLAGNGFVIDPESDTLITDLTPSSESAGVSHSSPDSVAISRVSSKRGKGRPRKSPSKSPSRTIWLSRVDDPPPADSIADQPVLIKPILPDDLLRLLIEGPSALPAADSGSLVSAFDEAPSTTGPRLLLVDDSPVNQTVIRDFLLAAGYRVDLAGCGHEAISAVESMLSSRSQFSGELKDANDYACVLMDLQMPEMDGIETMRQILRRYETDQRTPPPFIALTAHATADHRERCLGNGMKAFLIKPIDRKELVKTILQWAAIASPDSPPSDSPPSDTSQPDTSQPGETSPDESSPDESPADATVAVDQSSDDSWRAKLLSAAGGDATTADALVEAFLEEVPRLCRELRMATESEDAKTARRAAHTLKSCLKYVAPEGDWRLVESVEMAANQPDWRFIASFLPDVQSLADAWITRLKTYASS